MLGHITSYLPKAPDPFLTHDLVERMVSYPRRGNEDINFVVDDSKQCQRVKAALSDASNVFACEGTMEEPHGLWEPAKWMPLFNSALSKNEQEAVKKRLKQKQVPIDALLKVATPAPFGRDGVAVFDPEFRKAFEIPRSQLPSDLLQVLDLNARRGTMNVAETAMKPVSKKWNYHLYKIHMYGPGGKFEDHVDTLHKSNHVATVVLSLPSEHVGGTLRVRHHGEAIEFNSAKGSIKNAYGNGTRFRYGAFFTDCTHSVQEVTSGWRVVVQYDVYEEDGDDNQGDDEEIDGEDDNQVSVEHVASCLESNRSVGSSNIHNKEQTELVQAVLQYLTKIPPTDGVAFFLRHRYSLPALDEEVLKGADRTIYDTFSKREDLAITIQGVLVYIGTKDMEQDSVDVTAVSMKDFMPSDSGTKKSVVTGGNKKKRKIEKSTVHLIVDRNNGAMCVHETGETGNEPADGYTSYFVACVIIRPVENRKPAAKRRK